MDKPVKKKIVKAPSEDTPEVSKKAAPKKATKKPATKSEFVVDFNHVYFMRNEDNKHPQWRVIDAKGKVLGRLATQLADMLRGKDKPTFTRHAKGGDYVVVINAKEVVLTGKKETGKKYEHYTGWIGGLKSIPANVMREKHPDRIISLAVKGMLPKNKLSKQLMRRLLVYPGAEHPHSGNIKETVTL